MACFFNDARPTRIRRGFTLTEIAIVLGVVGLVLGGIWAAAATVYNNQKAAKAAGQVLTILNAYKALYGNRQLDVATLTDDTCAGVNAGFFPADMLPNVPCVTDPAAIAVTPIPAGEPTYPRTPWGGTSYVQVMINPAPPGGYISIRYFNLTQAACVAVATSSTGTSSNLVAENISGTTELLPPYGAGTLITIPGIATACSLPSGSNYLALGYPLH